MCHLLWTGRSPNGAVVKGAYVASLPMQWERDSSVKRSRKRVVMGERGDQGPQLDPVHCCGGGHGGPPHDDQLITTHKCYRIHPQIHSYGRMVLPAAPSTGNTLALPLPHKPDPPQAPTPTPT
ncbi:hypothetical protein VOLCADRAFT_96336 [Volvox carteri f. nagariensis]|uniref:Uncharacterized protein n=1 Tax=Volvox carteri f. nagariensis TaxID=3068 RepID=D8U9U6_VOLCA|nr:uncharacterized protein VOLCADRAFT_96336 [Volvox carteri f. nagariensis]EFJ43473.1 hypothetical protein VOLCADRAFT_96336 [Volvox carteri f. nagariensis]|eukprot:XP_002955402.1 hypothetical protein VOLCADRAFT_96336 [Volvox carteri f. nagariensis]